ncbi:MAG: hypothetical protein WDN31_14650 [Hyphomicrobium sp.]
MTHDRYFLDNLTDWTLELDRGQGVPYKGNYSAWLEQKAKRAEVEKSAEEGRQKQINRELEWIRASPKARQAKSKARVTAFDKLVEEAGREEGRQGLVLHRPCGAAPRRNGGRGRGPVQVVRRPAPHRRADLQAAAGRHRRRHRPQRRRQDDPVQDASPARRSRTRGRSTSVRR